MPMMTSQILKSVDFKKTQKFRYLENETLYFLQIKKFTNYTPRATLLHRNSFVVDVTFNQFWAMILFTCNQIDINVVISIKYEWNTVVWEKIRHLKYFIQNLLGVKVHTSCKMLKLCWHFGATKTHMDKIFEI